MSQKLIDIFADPVKAWVQLKERPTFLMPAMIVMLVSILAVAAYFSRVDPVWFTNYQLQALGQDMSASQIAQMQKFMPGARTQGWIIAATTLLWSVTVYALMALYYLVIGKVAGHVLGFRRGLALATWSSMPKILIAVVSIIATYASSPQTSYDSIQMLSVDPLLVQLPMDHDWSTLAKSFSLINFWVWVLASIGWKTWFSTSWAQAVLVAILPGFVVFGGMALVAMF